MQQVAVVERISKASSLLAYLTPAERDEFDGLLAEETPQWVPLPGPQTLAYDCQADVLYYGGSAGGGKSDLLLGLALNQFHHSIIFRRQTTQLVGIQMRLLSEILRSRRGWNGQSDILTLPDRIIEFGSCNNPGDEIKYQGRPHDLVCFDEITHFLESQFRFLLGWGRTVVEGRHTRVVCAGNPPTTEEGKWVVKYWAPWLDDKHHNPARSGELRWFTTIEGRDEECSDGRPIMIGGRETLPLSRTFIPSSVTDNPFLLKTGYESTLAALPEPLRSQMLLGDFKAGMEDNAWQLIPTTWIDAAMERWTESGKQGEMDSAGVDVARGGRDKTVVATRYGSWYDRLKSLPGAQTPNGATAAGFVVSCIRDRAVVHVDALGIGGETVGHLETNNIQVVPVVGYDTQSVIGQHDKATQQLKFRNLRAMIHWRFRESLDPITGDKVSLPPDPELKSDLCAPLWKLTSAGIQIEEKDEIKKRIGRSPDKGDAVIYASMATPKKGAWRIGQRNITEGEDWSPFDS